MKVIADLCLIPLSGEISLSPYVAECQRILEEAGVEHRLHAWGTNIEGEWETVMTAVKYCHMRVHEMGAPRITSTLKIGTRTDKNQTMADKVESVESLLKNS